MSRSRERLPHLLNQDGKADGMRRFSQRWTARFTRRESNKSLSMQKEMAAWGRWKPKYAKVELYGDCTRKTRTDLSASCTKSTKVPTSRLPPPGEVKASPTVAQSQKPLRFEQVAFTSRKKSDLRHKKQLSSRKKQRSRFFCGRFCSSEAVECSNAKRMNKNENRGHANKNLHEMYVRSDGEQRPQKRRVKGNKLTVGELEHITRA